MTPAWLVSNLASYWLQALLLIAAAVLLEMACRIRHPLYTLYYRQTVLAAVLLLPTLQPWVRLEADSSSGLAAVNITGSDSDAPVKRGAPWAAIILTAAVSGVALRGCWLVSGALRLRGVLRRAKLVRRRDDGVRIFVSTEFATPVTFGWRKPVVLLPPFYATLPGDEQEAILTHELLHIERADWPMALAEEAVRSLLWFHPAVWWHISRIQLAREHTVDRLVIERGSEAGRYAEALLSAARAPRAIEPAPANLFLKRRHLAKRVAALYEEVYMTRTRKWSSFSILAAGLTAALKLSIALFPLTAPAQEVVRGGDNLLHRPPVAYPADAYEKGIEGTVVVQAALDDDGNVVDARVVSGPEALRGAALKSVLDWHYSQAPVARKHVDVAIDFKIANAPPRHTPGPQTASSPGNQPGMSRVKIIGFSSGVAPELQERIKGKFSGQIGELLTPERLTELRQIVNRADRHLTVSVNRLNSEDVRIQLGYADAQASGNVPNRIRVGGNVQAANLATKVTPAYPPLAKQARIQGTVQLNVIIGKDGHVIDLTLISGHPILVPSAMEAVQQWVYRPTLLNGNPIEVQTTVDVNYTLLE